MPAGSASFINPVTVQAHEDLLVRANGRPPSETQHPGATSTLQLHQLLPKPQSVRQCRLWCLTIAPSRTLCRHGHRRARAAPGPQQRGAPQLAAAESVRAAAPSPLPQECRAQRRRCWPTCGRCPRARRCAGQHQASRHWERHVSCSVPATAFLGPHWSGASPSKTSEAFPLFAACSGSQSARQPAERRAGACWRRSKVSACLEQHSQQPDQARCVRLCTSRPASVATSAPRADA